MHLVLHGGNIIGITDYLACVISTQIQCRFALTTRVVFQTTLWVHSLVTILTEVCPFVHAIYSSCTRHHGKCDWPRNAQHSGDNLDRASIWMRFIWLDTESWKDWTLSNIANMLDISTRSTTLCHHTFRNHSRKISSLMHHYHWRWPSWFCFRLPATPLKNKWHSPICCLSPILTL